MPDSRPVEPGRHRALSTRPWHDDAPYAPGVQVSAGNLVFLSGQTARSPDGQFPDGLGLSEQTRRTFLAIAELLDAAGSSMAEIVKLTYYVTDMTTWPAVARVREEFLGGHRPASTAVEVSRLFDPACLIEIDVVATAT